MPPKSKAKHADDAFQPPAVPRNRQSFSGQQQQGRDGSDSPVPGASSMGEQQYKVARAISSCTRCRSRKQRCDGALPACGACSKAGVECIGFDAISKTNISRTHLHSLEQEVVQLRAQLAAYQSGDPTAIAIQQAQSQPVHSVPLASPLAQEPMGLDTPRSTNSLPTSDHVSLPIDPALIQDFDAGNAPVSSWDSPAPGLSHINTYTQPAHIRRSSEHLMSPHGDRSPSLSSAMNPKSQALTRMVHDAALRTGHASNQANAISAFNMPGQGYGSYSHPQSPHSYGQHSHQPHIPSNLSDHAGSHLDDTVSPQLLTRNLNGGGLLHGKRFGSLGNAYNLAHPPVSSAASDAGSSKAKRKPFSIPPLPPQPAVERLVAAYVDFVGVTAPIIHIPTLGQQLMRIREARDVEESDIFVVMMVLALSTMASARFVDPPDELRACSEAFHAEAMKHLDAVFEEQSYVGLQAILLLIWYSLLNPEKGSIWYLVGLATRTCVDMGYHNEHNLNVQIDKLDALELDMRRRLFYCTYKMDRLLSQALGRPVSIPDGFINVPLPSTLNDVDIRAGHHGPLPAGEACAYKEVFLHTVRLCQLQSEILNNTFGIHTGGSQPSENWANDCHDRLKEWLATTPPPRGAMTNEGWAANFHNAVLLLFRPSPGHPRPDRNALSVLLASSSYIIRIYRRMQMNNRIAWLWMTSHFCFMAGLSFLYAYLNLHNNAAGAEGIPTLEEAIGDVESCLATLEYMAPRVPSAGACQDTMRTVSSSILEQLRQSAARAPPTTSGSHDYQRGVFRGARISSSRDDPHPGTDFLAPLPQVTLPYELALLDNLFVNPMASHSKASDYTNGANCAKARAACAAKEVRNAFAGHLDPANNGAQSNAAMAGWATNVKRERPESGAQSEGSGESVSKKQRQDSAGFGMTAMAGPSGEGRGRQGHDMVTPTSNENGNGALDPMLAGATAFEAGSMTFDGARTANASPSRDTLSLNNTNAGQGQGQDGRAAEQLGQDAQYPFTTLQTQGLEGLGDFDFFSFLDDGFGQDVGLDGMALWS